jgi:hypothetical protein
MLRLQLLVVLQGYGAPLGRGAQLPGLRCLLQVLLLLLLQRGSCQAQHGVGVAPAAPQAVLLAVLVVVVLLLVLVQDHRLWILEAELSGEPDLLVLLVLVLLVLVLLLVLLVLQLVLALLLLQHLVQLQLPVDGIWLAELDLQ